MSIYDFKAKAIDGKDVETIVRQTIRTSINSNHSLDSDGTGVRESPGARFESARPAIRVFDFDANDLGAMRV